MRRKKHKSTRRAVSFYKINYGFHEPYKVLLDGNFIHATRLSNLGDLASHLPKLLGARCKLYTTKCVMSELHSMAKQSAEFKDSTAAARRYELHKCGHHDQPKAPAECILEQVGEGNEDHWWVATQDKAVRQQLSEVPGTPCIFATVNGLHLETPSEMTKSTVKEVESQHMSLPEHERQAEVLKDLEKLRPKLTTNVKFRRNFAKGPNPLSVKKKIKKATQPQQESSVADAEQTNKKKRRRKKNKAMNDSTDDIEG